MPPLSMRTGGDATTQALWDIMNNKSKADRLRLELALAMDMEILCSTTYKLEGDRLEILLAYDAVEALRERGRMFGVEASTLPNVAALLRATQAITVGLATNEYYEDPYNDWFKGKVSAARADSWIIQYEGGASLTIDNENEMRNAIDVCALAEWPSITKKIEGAFQYLEDRFNNNCKTPYQCKEQHRILGLLRAFNPSFAYGNVNSLWVRRLAALPLFAHIPNVDNGLCNLQ
uniref:Uncharacterized protein n=1 Tax=Strombidinopsis acuminata TaxID=141414 RepID=A0A7S3TSE4_9SPIT|mmetsp:Transcript_26517/g.80427  ORF Transcript_26517/g.80427 Transcript_26517/m.80427 type:complete len:233 (-) Transcript_26517:496-1194(-)